MNNSARGLSRVRGFLSSGEVLLTVKLFGSLWLVVHNVCQRLLLCDARCVLVHVGDMRLSDSTRTYALVDGLHEYVAEVVVEVRSRDR